MSELPRDQSQSKPSRPQSPGNAKQRRDRYSTAARWAGLTVRSREGKFLAETRADLIRHVGGTPSVPQRVLIERCAMLTLQLARMDAKALAAGGMSEHATREYLAWTGALARTMRTLGIQGAPPPVRTLADIARDTRRQVAA